MQHNVGSYTFSTSVRPLYITITKHNFAPYTAVTGGTFASNEIWFGDLNVLGNITISDSKLTILPGTKIKFKNGSQLNVSGTVIAEGVASDTIFFTSSSSSPQKGDWDWIKFDNSTGTSTLEYCNFEYAEIGIWCMNSSHVNISHVNVENCSNWGLYAAFNGNFTTVEYSTFKNNNDRGVYVYKSSPNLYHITSTDNQYGLFCYNSSLPQVGYSNFSNNSQDGVFCGSSSHPWMYYQTSFNRGWNNISGNNGRGVYACSGSYPRLGFNSTYYPGKNTIQGNSSYDVYNDNSGTTPIWAIYNWWDFDFSPIRDLHTPSTVNWDPVHPPSSMNLAKVISGDFDYGYESVLYHNQLGTKNLIEGNYNDALEAFQYAVNNYPDSLNTRYALIHIPYCFEGLKRTSEIISYLENVSHKNKNKTDLEGFALSLSVPYLENESRFHEATERCQQIRGFYQDKEINKNLLFIMANIHLYGIKDNEKAKLCFSQYLQSYPDDPMAETAQYMLEILGRQSLPKGKQSNDQITNSLPKEFALSQNYPNPFNPETEIHYQLPSDCRAVVTVYNLLGQKIRTLVDKTHLAGFYSVRWDGKDDRGVPVSSGVYIYAMNASQFHDVKKMMLLR